VAGNGGTEIYGVLAVEDLVDALPRQQFEIIEIGGGAGDVGLCQPACCQAPLEHDERFAHGNMGVRDFDLFVHFDLGSTGNIQSRLALPALTSSSTGAPWKI